MTQGEPQMCVLTFETLVQVIRASQGISPSVPITEQSDLEKDLGITGDDGDDLLEAVAQRFPLYFRGADDALREAFGLTRGASFFHSEGMGLPSFLATLWGKGAAHHVRAITVGQLFDALQKARHTNRT